MPSKIWSVVHLSCRILGIYSLHFATQGFITNPFHAVFELGIIANANESIINHHLTSFKWSIDIKIKGCACALRNPMSQINVGQRGRQVAFRGVQKIGGASTCANDSTP